MSKHVRFRKILASGLIALSALFAMPNLVSAAPYGADSYGGCNFSEGCAEATTATANSDDLSDTGENQRMLLYGALVLVGVGVIIYTIRRKRQYKLPR